MLDIVVVPDALREAINAKLDAVIAAMPEDERSIVETDRDQFYHQLVGYFHTNGVIPDFEFVYIKIAEPQEQPQ